MSSKSVIRKAKKEKERAAKLEKLHDKHRKTESNGDADQLTLSTAHRVLGAVRNAATNNSSYQNKGVKIRGLAHIGDPAQVTRALNVTERYDITKNRGAGTYDVIADPDSDEFALLETMIIATNTPPEQQIPVRTVASRLRTDTGIATTYLDLLADGGPVTSDNGTYTPNPACWR